MTKKNKSLPVVSAADKTESCACGEHCRCNEKSCGCLQPGFWAKSGVTVFSAAIIAGSILVAADLSQLCTHKAPRQPANIDATIRQYIVNNPKVLIDSVNAFYEKEKNQQPAAKPVQKDAPADVVAKIVNDKTNYSLGNPNGKFVIIEFFDYQCGWCKRTNTEIAKAIAEKDAQNIRWILLDAPIFGEASETISHYVLAAGKQGKFKEMHEAVGKATGQLTADKLVDLAKGLKLDVEKLKKDADSDEIKKKLADNKAIASSLNMNGVPMLIVDGKINPGALIGDKLADAVKASQAKK